jgi:alpha-1,3-rhamnosyl/mannosyltransferase
MRVAIDARYIRTTGSEIHPEGGIGRYTYELIRNLIELDPGLELTLIAPAQNRRPILHGSAAARVREIRYGAPPHTLRTLLALPRQIRLGDIDLFHSPFNVLPIGLPHRAVTTIHDMMWIDDPKLAANFWPKRLVTGAYYRFAMTNAIRRSAHILTVSEASKRAICRRFPDKRDNVTVTYHGVGEEFVRMPTEAAERITQKFVPPGTPFVLCVGQGSPYKNHARAIEAFVQAFADRPQVKLVLVRRFTRFDPTLRRYLAEKEMRDRLIVLPKIDEAELRALYSRALVLLFPSLCEGFGMPPLEAMACETPVVVSDREALAEICGEAALKVDPLSVRAIAAALRRITADGELRAELVARGRAHSRAFQWRHCAKATLDVYRKVAGAGGAPSR